MKQIEKIRIRCLDLALRYVEYEGHKNIGETKYFLPRDVVDIAHKFEDFVINGFED